MLGVPGRRSKPIICFFKKNTRLRMLITCFCVCELRSRQIVLCDPRKKKQVVTGVRGNTLGVTLHNLGRLHFGVFIFLTCGAYNSSFMVLSCGDRNTSIRFYYPTTELSNFWIYFVNVKHFNVRFSDRSKNFRVRLAEMGETVLWKKIWKKFGKYLGG